MAKSDGFQFDKADTWVELKCMLEKAITATDCILEDPSNAAHVQTCMDTYETEVEKPTSEGGCGVGLSS